MKLETRRTAQKVAALAVAACLATPSHAMGEFEPQATLYLSVPLGGGGSRAKAPSLGFMLRRNAEGSQGSASLLIRAPIVDVSISRNGTRMSMVGLEAYRSYSLDDAGQSNTPAPGPVLAVVALAGAIALGQAAKDDKKEKDDKNRRETQAWCSSPAGVLIIFPCIVADKSSKPKASTTKARTASSTSDRLPRQ